MVGIPGEVDLSPMETSLRGNFQFVLRDDMKLTWPQLGGARRRARIGW
jgi:hypothetical protein